MHPREGAPSRSPQAHPALKHTSLLLSNRRAHTACPESQANTLPALGEHHYDVSLCQHTHHTCSFWSLTGLTPRPSPQNDPAVFPENSGNTQLGYMFPYAQRGRYFAL